MSSLIGSLRRLLENNVKFEWCDGCEKAFQGVKTCIASDQVLAHYDPAMALKLACDASACGLCVNWNRIFGRSIRKIIKLLVYGYLESAVACIKCFTRCLFSQALFHMIAQFFVICDISFQGILNPLLREVSFAVEAATLAVFLFGTVFVKVLSKFIQVKVYPTQ